jgi:uncharacterized protein YegL
MFLQNEEFVARVEEKKKAKDIYNKAVGSNSAAGLVERDTRNANQIVVSVNVEQRGKAKFRLTYEELLQRQLSRYQHVLHVNLDQVVDDFQVQVHINESLPVVRVRVPELKTDPNGIDAALKDNTEAQIEKNVGGDPTKVKITFQPDSHTQKLMIQKSGKEGVQGQFIVEYDVDRKDRENDVQVLDGYFVHFFAPESLTTLPKHVVFVLDISGSMYGEKLQQTKDAMVTILDDLTEKDHFNVLTFSDDVTQWVPESERLSESPHSLTYKGTKELRDEALRYVIKLQTLGGTNIHDAMMDALKLVTEVKIAETAVPKNTKSIIVFLTDGEPTTGVTSGPEIERLIAKANEKLEVPIYGLAFGAGADFNLIKSISLKSGAFARKIFEGSDAAIQLEDFYRELANPLLNDVKFTYVGESFNNNSITKTDFNTYFNGSEYIIAGKLSEESSNEEDIEVVVGGEGYQGHYEQRFSLCHLMPRPLPIDFNPFNASADMEVESHDPHYWWPDGRCILPPINPKPKPVGKKPTNFIERLWAFLTIKNLLDEKVSDKEKRISELTNDETTTMDSDADETFAPKALPSKIRETPKKSTSEEKALELALKYNFVTRLTSLIVTRPLTDEGNSTEILIEPSPVREIEHHSFGGIFSSGFSGSHSHYGAPSFIQSYGGYNLGAQSFSGYNPGPQNYHLAALPANRIVQKSNSYGGGLASVRTTTNIPHYMTTFKPVYPLVLDYSEDVSTDEDNVPSVLGTGGKHLPHKMTTETDENGLTTESTHPTTASVEPCNITLFSQTYLRGENVSLTNETKDLAGKDFDNKTTSVQVTGNCCWALFSEPNFRGKSIQLHSGQFKSAGDLGELFRDVSSVQRC